ncbi:MAG TPA: hypothetical protein VNW72_00170 [Chthoniobacterales bacterium]|nr:hypothetical protein [Chthoniobacterales bacterium]
MLHCIGRIVMVLALCCAIGLHWIALQSLAWTAMVVQYSKCARLGQALEQTFDGAHPCSLCHVVNKGAASEKKSGAQSPPSKIDIVCVARTFQLLPRSVEFDYAASNCSIDEFEHSPPAPPPRSFLS